MAFIVKLHLSYYNSLLTSINSLRPKFNNNPFSRMIDCFLYEIFPGIESAGNIDLPKNIPYHAWIKSFSPIYPSKEHIDDGIATSVHDETEPPLSQEMMEISRLYQFNLNVGQLLHVLLSKEPVVYVEILLKEILRIKHFYTHVMALMTILNDYHNEGAYFYETTRVIKAELENISALDVDPKRIEQELSAYFNKLINSELDGLSDKDICFLKQFAAVLESLRKDPKLEAPSFPSEIETNPTTPVQDDISLSAIKLKEARQLDQHELKPLSHTDEEESLDKAENAKLMFVQDHQVASKENSLIQKTQTTNQPLSGSILTRLFGKSLSSDNTLRNPNRHHRQTSQTDNGVLCSSTVGALKKRILILEQAKNEQNNQLAILENLLEQKEKRIQQLTELDEKHINERMIFSKKYSDSQFENKVLKKQNKHLLVRLKEEELKFKKTESELSRSCETVSQLIQLNKCSDTVSHLIELNKLFSSSPDENSGSQDYSPSVSPMVTTYRRMQFQAPRVLSELTKSMTELRTDVDGKLEFQNDEKRQTLEF